MWRTAQFGNLRMKYVQLTFKNSVPTSQKTCHYKRPTFYRNYLHPYWELYMHEKHKHNTCEMFNFLLFNFKAGGIYNNQSV
jgi:hypothetical protein